LYKCRPAGRAKRKEILRGIEDVVDTEARFFSSTKRGIDTCINYTRPPLAIRIGQIKKAFLDAKSRGVRLRSFQILKKIKIII